MVDLLEFLGGDDPEYPQTLESARLAEDATWLLIFSKTAEQAKLHYVNDPMVHSYVPCPGAGCPICYGGQAAKDALLLPVVDVASRSVKVLRISTQRGPGSLLSELGPHLKGEDLHEKLFEVRRTGAKFKVQVHALGPDADRCLAVIKGFLAATKDGLRLSSAFPEFSAADLAEIPEVRRMLDARGGWIAPGKTDAAAE